MRLRHILVFFLLSLLGIARVSAQSPNGTISGLVVDPTGAVVVGADILLANDATGVQYSANTNESGIYVVSNLPPGTYRLQVSKIGFKTLIKPDIVLNVEDALAINFNLPLGATSETVTVTGGAPLVNTESASVSTVIDRNFVESLPLNGRSFNTLLQLTPGVVIAPSSVYANNGGQYSISGQRTSANNFLVDGVSANFGVGPVLGQGTAGTGAAQAFSALGGTSSLVSVEALQEFRIETSSFAPEFGRSPGGQVILTTRAGTNDFHAELYEYFRNDVLDANDWFANQDHLPRAPERHNDFGGYLGGPIKTNKTFFFVSYEGARLREPNTEVKTVPSEYARSTAPSSIAPFIDAFPQPSDQTVTPGVYTGSLTGNFSNPATLDAGSIRLDHTFNGHFSIFGRYNEAPSETAVRGTNSLSEVDTTAVRTRTLTVGVAMTLSPRVANNLRGNYSAQNSSFVSTLDSFDGATPPSLAFLAPGLSNPGNGTFSFYSPDVGFYETGADSRNRTRQLNFADDLSLDTGAHQLKFGADYRAIFLDLRPFNIGLDYEISSVSALLSTGEASDLLGSLNNSSYFLSQSASLYGQDTWRISPRVTLTYGLRWELSPPPSARGTTKLAAWTNVNNPATLALAPFGTPLWQTTYTNFAPRVGVAYTLTPSGNFVVRAGWGVFYDLGSDSAAQLGFFFPTTVDSLTSSVPLPLSDATPFIPTPSFQAPYPNGALGFSPNLKLPRSYQWNVALEKSFGGKQAVSVTYVGQAGRDLVYQEGINKPNANFAGFFILNQNGAVSNYSGLQLQYRRPFASRLQALFNYTWSHSLDNASDDVLPSAGSNGISAASNYASSDFDARHSFSGALTFAVPGVKETGPVGFATKNWSLDAVVVARTGFPFSLLAVAVPPLISGNPILYPRPDLIPGQPLWIPNSTAGGGKSVNPAAFADAPAGQEGTEGRNDIPGFGLTQLDFSLVRKFSITERVNLKFGVDAFNLFNHPNFANPLGYYFGPLPITTYLESPSMLNRGTGLGGLNPLFQEGGPRSLQLSLRLSF